MAPILRRHGRRRLRPRPPPQEVADAAVDARGQEDDEDDQEQAVDGLGHAHVRDAEHHAQDLGERDGQRGADGGAEQRVHPAQHHREHDAQRDADAGQGVGVHVGDVLRVRDAPHGGEHGREHGDGDLEARDVDADRGGRGLVLADRLHRRARHRAVHAVPHPEPQRPQHERSVVEDALVRELHGHQAVGARRPHGEAERASRPVALRDDEQAHDLADGEGDEPEVVADHLKARARVGDDHGEGGREHDGGEGAEPRREAEEVPEQRRRVVAEPEEGAVPERDEAEAAHERPRAADERPDEDLDQDVEDVLAHAAHRDERGGHERREQDADADAAGAHARLAKRPPGRTKIMMMKITKAITEPISVDHTTPPIEMISLMMNAATKAPIMFPSPPRTQIMNVSGPKAAPKNGCTEYWMISSAAATPARAPPTAEVTTYTVRGLAPMSAIASRSCETARMAVPMYVCLKKRKSPSMTSRATAKATRRANDRNMPPYSSVGSVSRTERWSVVHRNVANDWRKNSSPPVASSWFTGALPRIGEMISTCTAMPRSAPSPTLARLPIQMGQP